MYRGHRIVVVVPAFNEQRLIGQTLRSIPEFVDGVIVVDDASSDGTITEVNAVADPRVVLLRNGHNRGVGASIATGYQRSLRDGYAVAAVMAGDGQMHPGDLPPLLDPIVEGRADYAKGNRLSHPELLRRMPPMRVVGSLGLTALTRAASGYWDLVDSQCGYTAISSRTLRLLDLDALYPRYGYPNDLLCHLRVIGARVVDVDVRPVYGDEVSGFRWYEAIFTVGAVVCRAYANRLYRQYWRNRRPASALPTTG